MCTVTASRFPFWALVLGTLDCTVKPTKTFCQRLLITPHHIKASTLILFTYLEDRGQTLRRGTDTLRLEKWTAKAVAAYNDAEALVAWKMLERERKERNAAIRKPHQEAVMELENERDAAKAEKRRPRWAKQKQQSWRLQFPDQKRLTWPTQRKRRRISKASWMVKKILTLIRSSPFTLIWTHAPSLVTRSHASH